MKFQHWKAFGVSLRIFTQHVLFSFINTWRDSSRVVQEAIPLIAIHINDEALIIILKTKNAL